MREASWHCGNASQESHLAIAKAGATAAAAAAAEKKLEELPQKALAPARATCPMIPVIGHVDQEQLWP